MKIIMIIIASTLIGCSKNNFKYNTMCKNNTDYYFDNLDKLDENIIFYIIEEAEKENNKAIFIYIYLLNKYPNNKLLYSKTYLLKNMKGFIDYLYSNSYYKELGILYHYGIKGLLKPNAARAIEYYNEAIDMGNFKAIYNLGILYQNGIKGLLEPSADNAIEYYIKAIDRGHSKAANSLGVLYSKGVKGQLEPNISKAIEYFNKAIDIGNPSAFNNLGTLYYYGIKGQLDPSISKAIEYYTKAIDMGHSEAAYNLGLLYIKIIKGQSEPNISKAIKYLNKAIDMGHSKAAYKLVSLYYYGVEGQLEPNLDKTIEYFDRAKQMGCDIAGIDLNNLYNKLIKETLNTSINKAIKCIFNLYNKYNYKYSNINEILNINIKEYNNDNKEMLETYINNIKECYGVVLGQKIANDVNSTVSSFKHNSIDNDLFVSYDYISKYLENLLELLEHFDKHNFVINCIKLKNKSKFKNIEDDYVKLLNIKGKDYICLGEDKGYNKLIDIMNRREELLIHINKVISKIDSNTDLFCTLRGIISIEKQLYKVIEYTTSSRNKGFLNKYRSLFDK